MNGRTRKIRRTLAAVALSAAAALFAVPLAQAQDTILDVSARDARVQSQQPNVAGDYMFRDFLRNATQASVASAEPQAHPSQGGSALTAQTPDTMFDVWARYDKVPASTKPDIAGDFMFRQYFQQASRTSDHILDVSARDGALTSVTDHVLDVSARPLPGTQAPTVSEPKGGTDWRKIGIGIAAGMGGVLLLAALLVAGLEVRHARHRLGSA